MNWKLLAIVLGLLLVAAPILRAEVYEDSDEYGDEDTEDESVGEEITDPDVVVLKASNFDKAIKSKKFALDLKPEYAKAATTLKASAPHVLIAKVDATKETSLGERFQLESYPTLKWFVLGEPATEYNGERDEESMVTWVLEQSGPAAATLSSAAELAELEQNDPIVVVGYFKEFQGEAYEAFEKCALTIDDGMFAQTTDDATAKAAGLTAEGVAVITNLEGKKRAVLLLEGLSTIESIQALLLRHTLPDTIELTEESSEQIFQAGIDKQLLLFAGSADMAAGSPVFSAYSAAGSVHKGKLVFVTVDVDGPHSDPVVLGFFGISKEDVPAIVGFQISTNRKYRYTSELTEEAIKAFAVSMIDGSAVPFFRSQPIPESPKDGHVTVVVGKSFDAITKDASKDVLLLVYAPWSEASKAVLPIFDKLAKRFSGVESVVIAKMDGAENEHADVVVDDEAEGQGFPILIFYPAGEDKTAMQYDGERTVKGFTRWLKTHAKIPYDLSKKPSSEDAGAQHEEL